MFKIKHNEVNKKSGFTLIELLVVISIIGLLSSVVLASLNTSRIKARDAKRVGQLKQIQTALELYYSKYGEYYGSRTANEYYFARSDDGTPNSCGYTDFGLPPEGVFCAFENGLSEFIKPIPRDLKLSTYRIDYKYIKSASIQSYGLSIVLESPNSLSQNDGGINANAYEVGGYIKYCYDKYAALGTWSYWSGSANDLCGPSRP